MPRHHTTALRHARTQATFIAALLLTTFAHTANAEPTASLHAAHQAYYFAQYEDALALYQALAAQGDAEAAERAGYMLMQGPAAYGPRVPRDVSRATTLLEQAANAGRPHAPFLLGMMDGTD